MTVGARRVVVRQSSLNLRGAETRGRLNTGRANLDRPDEGGVDPDGGDGIVGQGARMTAMPAWSESRSDAQLWSLVAFLEAMPYLTPFEYARMRPTTRGRSAALPVKVSAPMPKVESRVN